jgi:glutathione S-transferase
MSEFVNLLAILEDRMVRQGGPFIAGKRFSVADCQVWPVVDEEVYPGLAEWYRMTWRKKACVKKLREKLPEKKTKEVEGEKVEKE